MIFIWVILVFEIKVALLTGASAFVQPILVNIAATALQADQDKSSGLEISSHSAVAAPGSDSSEQNSVSGKLEKFVFRISNVIFWEIEKEQVKAISSYPLLQKYIWLKIKAAKIRLQASLTYVVCVVEPQIA